jgi:hypothetical protein
VRRSRLALKPRKQQSLIRRLLLIAWVRASRIWLSIKKTLPRHCRVLLVRGISSVCSQSQL